MDILELQHIAKHHDTEESKKLLGKMPKEKKGYRISYFGKDFLVAIRCLSPKECDTLQGVPNWYRWGNTSNMQHYKMIGNAWQVDTIKHCFESLRSLHRPLRVWSLFDGMGCAYIALKELNIPIEVYVSSEIDKYALEVERTNIPNIKQVGSVISLNVDELVQKYGIPDLICGGSPCTDMSFVGTQRGMITTTKEEVYTLERYLELKEQGFKFEGQSYLFWEFKRILSEVQKISPDVLFFLENVEMQDKWERCISHTLGICGVHINSALVSAQSRKRIYWSNIRKRLDGVPNLFGSLYQDNVYELPLYKTDIAQPTDRKRVLKDILENDVDERYYLSSDLVKDILLKEANSNTASYQKERILKQIRGVNDKSICLCASMYRGGSNNAVTYIVELFNID